MTSKTLLCSPPQISGSPEMGRPEQRLPVEEPKEAPCPEEAAGEQDAEIDPALDHFKAKRAGFERGSSRAATIPRSEPPLMSPGSTKVADKVPQDASDVVEEKWEALPPTLPRRVLQALFGRTFTKLVDPPRLTTLAWGGSAAQWAHAGKSARHKAPRSHARSHAHPSTNERPLLPARAELRAP